MRISTMVVAAALTLVVPSLALPATVTAQESRQHVAKVNERAPYFALDALVSLEKGKEFRRISLDDYRGRWVVLFFYPMDFTFVCPTEIKGFSQAVEEFKKLNAVVIGASTDTKYSHLAWAQRGDLGPLTFPILADVKKEIAQSYGCLDEKEGVALRALYIIDPEGILQYEVVHNLDVGRSVDETLRVLQALQTGSLCPLNWKPGQKTIQK